VHYRNLTSFLLSYMKWGYFSVNFYCFSLFSSLEFSAPLASLSMLKVVILCTSRTGHRVKNHWACIKNKKVESHLVKGLSEQFTHRPIDSLITNNKGTSTNKSVHDSSTNVHVSSEMPVSPKLDQALTGSARNPSTLNGKTSDITYSNGSVPHLVNVSQKVDGQITTSNLLSVTKEPRRITS
jgi:hypothetical protein